MNSHTVKNKNSSRYFSNNQETYVCKTFNCTQQSNSGAGLFNKGDCINKDASLLVECKTSMTDKDSFSIKKEWLIKNKEEAFEQRLNNSTVCFSFGPTSKNYFIIDEKLMKFLVEKLEKDLS